MLINFTADRVWLGSGGPANNIRRRLALLTPEGRVTLFKGRTIPGVVEVLGVTIINKGTPKEYERFELVLAPGVKAYGLASGKVIIRWDNQKTEERFYPRQADDFGRWNPELIRTLDESNYRRIVEMNK